MSDLQTKIEELKRDFGKFLKSNNDFRTGKVVRYVDAKPGTNLQSNFFNVGRSDKDTMTMGIMFHGTHENNIAPICKKGLHVHSCFTSSFHYAARRSEYKEGYRNKKVKVMAMAVLVEDADGLASEDRQLKEPYYSLPLFVVTVRV